MDRKELHFQVPESMLDTLDLEAMARGLTRAELVRLVVDKSSVEDMDSHRLTQLSVTVNELQHRKIKLCSERLGITMSAVMRVLIEKMLRGAV
jgi:16S rRNA U516 pseudouridylate synthase RsuA-like enzyme